MQGAIGFFLYSIICSRVAPQNLLLATLPPTQIPITHEWDRYYAPQDLCDVMSTAFNPYAARVGLIAVIGSMEGNLGDIMDRLHATGHRQGRTPRGYKDKLRWAFPFVLNSSYGNAAMQGRKARLCLDIDHARRLRNLWMHNNGLYDSNYPNDIIPISGEQPIIDPIFIDQFQRRRRKKVSVIINSDDFIMYVRSHIEFLHHLHDTIQRQFFGQIRSYGYRALQKRIEWQRLLTGM